MVSYYRMRSILRRNSRINLLQPRNDLSPNLLPDCPLSRSRDILPRTITSSANFNMKRMEQLTLQ